MSQDDSILAIDESENETPDGTSNFSSSSTTRTPWLDTVGTLIDTRILTWDNTGQILNCPENDDDFIQALNYISARPLKNPILSFKKNMGNYQFKKVIRSDIKHLAYTNEFYNSRSRYDKIEMERLTNLVKNSMKQANDAKKLRNEGRKREENPISSSFSHSSLSKKPRVEDANLLLNLQLKNESTPQHQNSSFGTPAFNSNSNNFNSSNNNNDNNAGNMFGNMGNMFNNNMGNNMGNTMSNTMGNTMGNNMGNDNSQMMMQMMMMQMMGNQQNNFNPQNNSQQQHNNMNNSMNNSMNPMMNMMMQNMMQNMNSMQSQISSLADLLKKNHVQSNGNTPTTANPSIPNLGSYSTSDPPQIGLADGGETKHIKTEFIKPKEDSLFLAIRAKDLGKVSTIVDSKKEWWKIVDENDNSPLIAACSHTDSKVFIVSYLIDLVKDNKIVAEILTHQNKNGLNCYLMASKTGNIELIKYIEGLVPSLSKQGHLTQDTPVLKHRDNNHNNALILASSSTSLETVKHLIDKTKMDIFSVNADLFTPMLMSIDSGRLEIMEYLGALRTENLERKTGDNDTTLTLAIQSKSGIDMVKKLVENYKVSIFEGGYLDRLPFSIAAEYDEMEILKYLFEKHSSAKNSYPVTSYNDSLGDNALHMAAKFGGLEVFKFLLNIAMFDPFEKGYLGRNAYHWACVESNFKIIKYLRNTYPGIESIKDSKDQTPLTLVITYAGEETLEYLLSLEQANGKNKVDILKNQKGFMGRNIIHSAIIANSLQCLELFEQFYHDMKEMWTALDDGGSSVLSLAAEFADFETFEYVFQRFGVDKPHNIFHLSSIDKQGKSCLDCAILSSDLEKVKYICNVQGLQVDTMVSKETLFYYLDYDSEPEKAKEISDFLSDRFKLKIETTDIADINTENKSDSNENPVRYERWMDTWMTFVKSVYDKNLPNFEKLEDRVEKKSEADLKLLNPETPDWTAISTLLRNIVHRAQSEFEVEGVNNSAPESLISTRSGGMARKPGSSSATGAGVSLPQQYQRIITDGYSLEGDKAKFEIAEITQCDAKKALMQYICFGFKSKLEQTIQRIRRKLIYIVSYRRHQLRTRQVNLDASFNKYTTSHPDRPMYSAKSMLKLIRWCRFFEREYKPILSVQVTIHGGMSDTQSSVGSAMSLRSEVLSISSSGSYNTSSGRGRKMRIEPIRHVTNINPDGTPRHRRNAMAHGTQERSNPNNLNSNPASISSSSSSESTLTTINRTRSVTFTLNRISLEFADFFNRWLLKSLQIHGQNISKNMNPKEHILHIVPRTDHTAYGPDQIPPPINYNDKKVKERIENPLKEELYLENFQTENCIVCQNKEYVDYDYGIPICQTCLYRRNLFLFGSNLQCNICEVRLDDDKFEGWLGASWCKRCLSLKQQDLVLTDGKAPTCEKACNFDHIKFVGYDHVSVDHKMKNLFSTKVP